MASRFGKVTGDRDVPLEGIDHPFEDCTATATSGVLDVTARIDVGTFNEVTVTGYGDPTMSDGGKTITYPHETGADLQNVLDSATMSGAMVGTNVSIHAPPAPSNGQMWLETAVYTGITGFYGLCTINDGSGKSATVGVTSDGSTVVISDMDGSNESAANITIGGRVYKDTSRIMCVFSSETDGFVAAELSDDTFVLQHITKGNAEYDVTDSVTVDAITPIYGIGMVRNDTYVGAALDGNVHLFNVAGDGDVTVSLGTSSHTFATFLGLGPTPDTTFAIWLDDGGVLCATGLEYAGTQTTIVVGALPTGFTANPNTVSIVPLEEGPVLVLSLTNATKPNIYRVPLVAGGTFTLVQARETANQKLVGLRAVDYSFNNFCCWIAGKLSWIDLQGDQTLMIQTADGTWTNDNAPPLMPYGLVYGNITTRINGGVNTNASFGVSFQRQFGDKPPLPPTPTGPRPTPTHSMPKHVDGAAAGGGTSAVLLVLGILALLLAFFL